MIDINAKYEELPTRAKKTDQEELVRDGWRWIHAFWIPSRNTLEMEKMG